MKALDLLNKKYELLTVVKRVENSKANKAQWLCKCECGGERKVVTNELTRGRASSCGCSFKKRKKLKQYLRRSYVVIKDPEHPNADSWGYVLEHVKVISEHLNRKINPDEIIHHKNGIKTDNNIDNLEIWTVCHPRGQRVEDMIDFCVDYLKQYKPEILVI